MRIARIAGLCAAIATLAACGAITGCWQTDFVGVLSSSASGTAGAPADGGPCGVGAALCNGTCIDVQTDDANCGACANACDGSSSCSGGVCTCKTGFSLCGDQCMNTKSNPLHCGTCDTMCMQGETCVAGACM